MSQFEGGQRGPTNSIDLIPPTLHTQSWPESFETTLPSLPLAHMIAKGKQLFQSFPLTLGMRTHHPKAGDVGAVRQEVCPSQCIG